MSVAKTAKRGAKGWIGVKAVKGAGKGASKVVRRRTRRPLDHRARRQDRGRRRPHRRAGIVLAKIDRRKAAGRAKGAVQGAARPSPAGATTTT